MHEQGQDLLSIESLTVAYGPIVALRDVSLRVRPGEAVAILGTNGAGKTTLLNALSGMVPAQRGDIQFQGRRILGRRAAQIVKAGIAHVPEGRQIFQRLSVTDNLRLGAYPIRRGRLPEGEVEAMFELFPRLKERSNQTAGTLSGGEQQMLAIARAMLSNPKLLLLDEPSMGLAPIVVDQIFDALVRISTETSLALLLVEQNARAALDLASRGYLLESGSVVAEGNAGSLSDAAIAAAYLGTSQ